jgi:hypothetical protein
MALVLGTVIGTVTASNLANPLAPLPPARVAIGVSYHLGGHTITQRRIPALLNRFNGRATYAPFSFLSFGVDLGATRMDVAADTTAGDTVGLFHGDYRFSAGGHLKLSSPLFRDRLGVVGIARATTFSSGNDYDALYGGIDGNGALGLLVHIPGFGYAAAGPKLYLIRGENTSHDGTQNTYANVNNLRGWLAVDYFPRVSEKMKNRPYLSFEIALSPEAAVDRRAPIQEFSFSLTFGTVTPRLYGEVSEVPWQP